ncbi:periplasmic heavy metal sensor [Pseudogemmobacter sonorensis]|uniref:periplasmic heavy metal sensor n=1 Tax=Pseudogemmobacter sonorensis TaxID=2989681 RepID=UPI00367A92DA
MNETPSSVSPPSVPAAARTRGWVRIVLAVSLALNLAVVGLTAGIALRHGGPQDRGGGQDFGLGPLARALPVEERKALRRGFIDNHPELAKGTEALKADFDRLLAILRSESLDPAALDAALAQIALRNAERLTSGSALIGGYLARTDAAGRADYADRLAEVLGRGARRGSGPGGAEGAGPDGKSGKTGADPGG